MTQFLTLSPHSPSPELIRQAADVILRRGLVAFPTETVYGLFVSASRAQDLITLRYVDRYLDECDAALDE